MRLAVASNRDEAATGFGIYTGVYVFAVAHLKITGWPAWDRLIASLKISGFAQQKTRTMRAEDETQLFGL